MNRGRCPDCNAEWAWDGLGWDRVHIETCPYINRDDWQDLAPEVDPFAPVVWR